MMTPQHVTKRLFIFISLMMALLLLISSSYGKHKNTEAPPFQYEVGTENFDKGCGGKLEVFRCPGGTLHIPYSGITVMQYRPNISDEVLAMKIPWIIKPQLPRVRNNKFFTLVWNDSGKVHAVVLRVEENYMRPYFAEIELQSGKSVQEYRSFDEF